jgi:phosphatidylserine decarboxylase
MLFNQMFEQVPKRAPYHKDPAGKPQVRDYRQMVQLLDTIMTHAPAFLNPRVNAQLKAVLSAWAQFLRSSDSTYVLNDDPQKAGLGPMRCAPCRTSRGNSCPTGRRSRQ